MTVLNAPAVLGELDEAQIRVDLAAAFRIAARMDLHESVSNPVSYTHLTLPTKA